ncbi:hypothetical protein [Actinoplanes sp. NPDC048796]|uniref:hypothetical protein n=1 Tax=unclassified Actinoplanes TaxID=2626549 RepID=UPI00340E60E4
MEHDHRLSDAMAAYEHTNYDVLALTAKVESLAGRYRRRQVFLRSTAGVVIGASLFAGASYLHGHNDQPMSAAGAVTVAAQAEPSPDKGFPDWLSESDRVAITRFSAAGYDYADAARLAVLWKTENITATKIEAGEQLLDKRPLPFPPTSQVYDGQTPEEAAMVDAFFARGYDFGDARQLAKLWKKASAYEAKVEAGKKLLNGETLPLRP